jgi:hypothetical protein
MGEDKGGRRLSHSFQLPLTARFAPGYAQQVQLSSGNRLSQTGRFEERCFTFDSDFKLRPPFGPSLALYSPRRDAEATYSTSSDTNRRNGEELGSQDLDALVLASRFLLLEDKGFVRRRRLFSLRSFLGDLHRLDKAFVPAGPCPREMTVQQRALLLPSPHLPPSHASLASVPCSSTSSTETRRARHVRRPSPFCQVSVAHPFLAQHGHRTQICSSVPSALSSASPSSGRTVSRPHFPLFRRNPRHQVSASSAQTHVLDEGRLPSLLSRSSSLFARRVQARSLSDGEHQPHRHLQPSPPRF